MAWTPTLSAVLGGATKLSDLAEVNNNAKSERNASTGAILTTLPVVIGGAGISSVVSIDNTTESTSAITGSIHTDGGLGVAKASILAGGVQTDGTNTLKTKIIDIGDWDMNATTNVQITHGLDFTKIRSINAIIRDDADTTYHLLMGGVHDEIVTPQGTIIGYGSTSASLYRLTGGLFDSPSYDSTSFNRGWVTITYVV